jgi:HD-GYP domain-containing protein (c-di-GMP phosphodiesterase class II)
MNDSAGALVNSLTVGLTCTAIYYREHPRVVEASSELIRILQGLWTEEEKDRLFLGVVNGRLVFRGRPLVGPTLIARRIVEAADALRCGGFLFCGGLTTDELRDFFVVCAELRRPTEDVEQSLRLLQSRGVKHVELSPRFGEPGWLGDQTETRGVSGVREITHFVEVYQEILRTVEAAHVEALRDRGVGVNNARTTAEKIIQAMAVAPDDLLGLTQYPDYDSYTVGHSVRVALFAILVGNRLGLERHLLLEVGTAALLHDVGKSKIPDDILYKRARLDEEERRVMKRHPWLGGQILIQSQDASALSIGAAFGHHVRHDRKGYPAVPDWACQSKVTALVEVCDVFEALTAVRPYKGAMTPRNAYRLMLRDHGAFDPELLSALIQTFGFYPPGASVELSSGDSAVVCSATVSPDRPIVKVTHDRDGSAYPEEARVEINLEHEEGIRVTRMLQPV